MSQPDSKLDTAGRQLTEGLLRETREELLRADGKAQILFAVSGVVIGVVLGGILAGDWKPADLACKGEVIWWAGVVAAAVGLGSLLRGIWPRLDSSPADRIFYFEDIWENQDTRQLISQLNEEAEHGQRDVEQLRQLSKIAHRKYVAVRVAMIALVTAAGLCVLGAWIG